MLQAKMKGIASFNLAHPVQDVQIKSSPLRFVINISTKKNLAGLLG